MIVSVSPCVFLLVVQFLSLPFARPLAPCVRVAAVEEVGGFAGAVVCDPRVLGVGCVFVDVESCMALPVVLRMEHSTSPAMTHLSNGDSAVPVGAVWSPCSGVM